MVTNHVYTFAGAKGGVGKTTSSINLGTLLAAAGYSTVVVKMDLAMANIVDFLDVDIDTDEDATFHDVLAGNASVTEATYETDADLSIVPSGTTLEGYADTDLDRLPGLVETLRWHHDIVLLDTPAGLSEETIQPLKLADHVLLVSTPRVASIRNVSNTKELAERVEAPVRGLILTKSGTGASPGADEISEFLDVELLGHVPEDDAVSHSQDSGVPVVQTAPSSGAAIAYERISEQLIDTAKASTDSTADATTEAAPGDTVPTSHRTDDQAHGRTTESVETTDGGRKIRRRDGIADDGGDRPADDTATSPASVSGPQPADSKENTGTAPVIDGTDLVDSEPGPVDRPDRDVALSDSTAETSQCTTDGSGHDAPEFAFDPAIDSSSDSQSNDDADAGGSGAAGLGERMRSLFGL
ncbi:P-loop NTPase [Haloarcula quadrata]|nr:P-loop NTPase [Haloarcula quadrata]